MSKKTKKKGLNLIHVITVLVLLIISASFTGLLDITGLSPNSWQLKYYVYNVDSGKEYRVGSPFVLDGAKFLLSNPNRVNNIWSHSILSKKFVDKEKKEVLPGINAVMSFQEPTTIENVKTAGEISTLTKNDSVVTYTFSFTDNVLTAKAVTGDKTILLNSIDNKAVVEFTSLTNIKGGVSVTISSGLFTGGGVKEYDRNFEWKTGTNKVIIDLPSEQLGLRTVEVKPYALVYDMSTYGKSDLCWVIDKNYGQICASQKTINIPTQVRFGYSTVSKLPITGDGEVAELVFAENDDGVKIVNVTELNFVEKFVLWIKRLFGVN